MLREDETKEFQRPDNDDPHHTNIADNLIAEELGVR